MVRLPRVIYATDTPGIIVARMGRRVLAFDVSDPDCPLILAGFRTVADGHNVD